MYLKRTLVLSVALTAGFSTTVMADGEDRLTENAPRTYSSAAKVDGEDRIEESTASGTKKTVGSGLKIGPIKGESNSKE